MAAAKTTAEMLNFLQVFNKGNSNETSQIILDGKTLDISTISYIALNKFNTKIAMSAKVLQDLDKNASFFSELLSKDGAIVYGANTGYGGSADVRSSDVHAVQRALVTHLNAGFGERLDSAVVRAAMVARVNSLSLAYSGVRPLVVELLCKMVNKDIVPVVPLRGSVSASGDLMPLSYIAAAMMGRKESRVIYKGAERSAHDAFEDAGLKFVKFEAKEALAVVNASSVASSLAALVLVDAAQAHLLTQVVSALFAEGICGRMETFHRTVMECLPHQGNQEVASNIKQLLRDSKMVQHAMEWKVQDHRSLKQDRYTLRTVPQWLGPAYETWTESLRRVSIELNSSNDNPLVDHRTGEVLHCGNFQGTSSTVAMDQLRQSLQLCGRLVFAQLTEILNHTMGHGLPPNLSGDDCRIDFGFKGVDTATAAYTSELNFLTQSMSSFVLSAEMHNQSVNSLALISARMTQSALNLLNMILTNALCALCQAIDLCWLRTKVFETYHSIASHHDKSEIGEPADPKKSEELPSWYDMVFASRRVADQLLNDTKNGCRKTSVESFVTQMEELVLNLQRGVYSNDVAALMGKGTSKVYLYIRESLGVKFYRGGSESLDTSLTILYEAVKDRKFIDVILNSFDVPAAEWDV